MATLRSVDRHFYRPGQQKSWRKGKISGDATRKCSKRLTRLTRSLWRTRLRRPQRPSPSKDADPELRHSTYPEWPGLGRISSFSTAALLWSGVSWPITWSPATWPTPPTPSPCFRSLTHSGLRLFFLFIFFFTINHLTLSCCLFCHLLFFRSEPCWSVTAAMKDGDNLSV